MYYISKRIEISAAHRLELPYASKCANLHGHNWIVTVHCASPVLNEAGIDLMLCGHDHRYSFHPAGERDAKFPIVVNDNRSCVRCDVADSLIRVRIAGPRDKTVHTHEFPLKPQFQP